MAEQERSIGKMLKDVDPILVREISGFLVHCSDCEKIKSCTKYSHIFNNRKILKGIGLRCTEFKDIV